jgi:hypothetical protein
MARYLAAYFVFGARGCIEQERLLLFTRFSSAALLRWGGILSFSCRACSLGEPKAWRPRWGVLQAFSMRVASWRLLLGRMIASPIVVATPRNPEHNRHMSWTGELKRLFGNHVVDVEVAVFVTLLADDGRKPNQRPCGEGHYSQLPIEHSLGSGPGRRNARTSASGVHRGGSCRSSTRRISATVVRLPTPLAPRRSTMRTTSAPPSEEPPRPHTHDQQSRAPL